MLCVALATRCVSAICAICTAPCRSTRIILCPKRIFGAGGSRLVAKLRARCTAIVFAGEGTRLLPPTRPSACCSTCLSVIFDVASTACPGGSSSSDTRGALPVVGSDSLFSVSVATTRSHKSSSLRCAESEASPASLSAVSACRALERSSSSVSWTLMVAGGSSTQSHFHIAARSALKFSSATWKTCSH